MKKSVLASLLALATIFPVSVPMVYGQAAQSGQLTIKDPQEYNDYTNAVGQSTPAAKAAAIETFLTKYPNSVVKNDLLEVLMASYQQAGDMTPGTCAHWRFRFTSRNPRPLLKPLLPMLSLSLIRRQPRHRRVSAPPSRRTCRTLISKN
jgi:hypothetical protein